MPLTGLRSFNVPINPASIVSSAYGGWDAAQAEQARAQEMQARAQQMLVTQLQIEEARKAIAERERATSLLPALFGVTGKPTTLTSGAVPPVLTMQAGEFGDVPGAADVLTPGLPSRSETLTSVSPQSIAQAVGSPENLASVLRDPTGRAIISDFLKPETPEQSESKRRKTQANLDFKQAQEESDQLAAAGDKKGYLRASARAYGFLADAVDDQHRATVLQRRKETLDTLADVARKDIEHDPELQRISTAAQAFSTNPRDPAAFWRLWEEGTKAKDETNQQLVGKFLPDAYKEFRAAKVQGELDDAIDVITRSLLEKRVDRRNRQIMLDDDEQQKIALEVMQAHPTEFAIFDRAMLTGKSKVSDSYFRWVHPELTGPKEWQLYEKAVQLAGPGAPAERIDSIYQELRKGESPSTQRSKQALDQARATAATAKAAYDRERGAAGMGAGAIRPETLQGLTLARKRLSDQLNALPGSNYTEAEQKQQATILKGEIADVDDRLQEAHRARRGGPGSPTAAPAGPKPSNAALFQKAKALHAADPDPAKGSWDDPAVRRKYYERAAR